MTLEEFRKMLAGFPGDSLVKIERALPDPRKGYQGYDIIRVSWYGGDGTCVVSIVPDLRGD